FVRVGRAVRDDEPWRQVAAVVGVSLLINVVGIFWGLPGRVSWLGDELVPAEVLNGLSQHFSNGWYNPYPPLQFYVLSGVFSPFLLLEGLGRIDLTTPFWYTTLFVTSRVVSLAAGVGTLIALYRCGAEAFSTRAGLFAAASLAVVAPF